MGLRFRSLSSVRFPKFGLGNENRTPNELFSAINAMKTEVRPGGNGNCEIKVCKMCAKENKENSDNLWKLIIRPDGSFHCYRCSTGGNWHDLKNKVSQLAQVGQHNPFGSPQLTEVVIPNQLEVQEYSKRLQFSKEALTHLTAVRGINQEILKMYQVGVGVISFPSDTSKVWERTTCITFPWIVDKIIRVKFRSIKAKGKQRLYPKGGGWGYFGWHLIKPSDSQVLITEGEYDAMSVAQALQTLPTDHPLRNLPAISLPNGCKSFRPEIASLVQRFEKIYLWLDNDEPGKEGIDMILQKIHKNARCYIIAPSDTDQDPPKDANDLLRRENGPEQIVKMVQEAKIKIVAQDVIKFSQPAGPAHQSKFDQQQRLLDRLEKLEKLVLSAPLFNQHYQTAWDILHDDGNSQDSSALRLRSLLAEQGIESPLQLHYCTQDVLTRLSMLLKPIPRRRFLEITIPVIVPR